MKILISVGRALCEKCPNTERKTQTRINSVYEHFSRSGTISKDPGNAPKNMNHGWMKT